MKKNILIFFQEKPLKMLCLGFSSGLPILLVFSTLSVWLVKAGISRSTVTLFSWAGFAYAFKYLWSPLVDNFSLPILNKLGHRRSWLLLSQFLIVASLILTSLTDPKSSLYITAIAIVFLAFSSATQDIVIDAFRIESAPQYMQGPLSSMYIAGYRIAMLTSGAGSLWLAAYLGAEVYAQDVWQKVYFSMSILMLVGIFATIISKEPNLKRNKIMKRKNYIPFLLSVLLSIFLFIYIYSIIDNPFNEEKILLSFLFSFFRILVCFLSASTLIYILIKFKFISKKIIKSTYFNPILNFLNRYGKFAFFILLLISLYRIADIVMGVIANIFYLEKGYNIEDIATY